jgi:hypothetical protein
VITHDEALEQLMQVTEWAMAKPHCDTGYRGDDHEPCHQQREVWEAELLKRANTALAAVEQATPEGEVDSFEKKYHDAMAILAQWGKVDTAVLMAERDALRSQLDGAVRATWEAAATYVGDHADHRQHGPLLRRPSYEQLEASMRARAATLTDTP